MEKGEVLDVIKEEKEDRGWVSGHPVEELEKIPRVRRRSNQGSKDKWSTGKRGQREPDGTPQGIQRNICMESRWDAKYSLHPSNPQVGSGCDLQTNQTEMKAYQC